MAGAERLRGELYAAFKNRALMYWHVFDELRKALGEPQATGLMARAIEARGREIGRQFARYAPADLTGLRDAFIGAVPDEGRMFAPRVQRCDAAALDIALQRCPLKEAWQEAGVSETDVATLCRIAGRVDNGTFEAAGFEFSADTWQPGREGCCHLHIRPGPTR
jgi:L-2-amino-thiazoline-4-carboxylic acid hydrolase